MKILVPLFVLLTQVANAADQWPRFRGPMGAGAVPADCSIPSDWSEKGTQWSAKLSGVGHSSPVIWDGKVFVTSAQSKGEKRVIECFDLKNGTALWKKEIQSKQHKRHKFNSYATSTPAVDSEHVYLLWGQPDRVLVIAYSHDGEEKWRKNLGKYKSGHGFGVSPIVADGKLIIANDQEAANAIVALDAKTGDIAWTSKRKPKRATYTTPVLFPRDNAGTDVIVSDWQQGITAIDLKSGKERWTRSVFDVDDKQRAIGSPIIWDDLIIATCGFAAGNRRLVALKSGAEKPEPAFQLDDYIPHVPTPIAHDGRLYLWSESGIVSCYELPSGEPIYERERVPAKGKYFSSPIAINGHLINFSNNGDVVILKCGDEFEIVTETKLPEPTQATPAAADGHLVVRTESTLFVYK